MATAKEATYDVLKAVLEYLLVQAGPGAPTNKHIKAVKKEEDNIMKRLAKLDKQIDKYNDNYRMKKEKI